jgi:transposase
MEAFRRAMVMVEGLDVPVGSVSLDRYYSSRSVLGFFGGETAIYLIPKRNISRVGFGWARIVERTLMDPVSFLRKYCERQSE